LREGESPLRSLQSELLFEFAERDQHHRFGAPIARLEQGRQDKVGRRPIPSRLVRICRSSGDSDECFARKGVDRFAATAVLDGKQTELFVIEFACVGSDRLLCSAKVARDKQSYKNRQQLLQGDNFIPARRFPPVCYFDFAWLLPFSAS
jgi:hypothetical protein